jgi:hypothetical protein
MESHACRVSFGGESVIFTMYFAKFPEQVKYRCFALLGITHACEETSLEWRTLRAGFLA